KLIHRLFEDISVMIGVYENMSDSRIPLVSIIIPVYNVELYLRECLDSVCRQTFRNLEIILINDGSPDHSGEICEEYSSQDERIKVIHKKNGGLSDARNAGLNIATGDYIAFIDSDDVIDQDFIQILLEVLLNSGASISMCDYITFSTGVQIAHQKYTNSFKLYTGAYMLN